MMKNTDKIIEMKTAGEILSSKAKQLDTSQSHWGNQKVTAAQAIGAMEEFAQQNTLNRDKVMEIIRDFRHNGFPLEVWPNSDDRTDANDELRWQIELADALCSLSLPTLSEGEINPFPKSLYPDHHKAWEIGFKAAIKQPTKTKEG